MLLIPTKKYVPREFVGHVTLKQMTP